jgi:NAD(P)-dependent dehydrogenase (short-subunit alcohol dehydrogenase family)
MREKPAMSDQCLKERVVVIMGGTTGLGLSAAIACLRAGACVVACGRSAASARKAAELLGAHSRVFTGDAQDATTADEAIKLAISAFGRFDAFYHVAGGSGRAAGDGPLHELTDEGIEQTLNHNLKSLIYSNRAAVQTFRELGTGGSILNMGSVLGWSPSPAHFATHVYAAAKAATIGFTKNCAAYYAPENIRFNVVAPALVETPMSQRAIADETILQFVKQKQPLDGRRIGRPEDLDAAVIYFLSDASRYVTGQVLAVDGGWCVSDGVQADG